jgi:hypothetical protein
MKTVQEYMHDPRITNDPGLMAASEELRIIHAARLRLQDETTGMTTVERSAYLKKKTLQAGSTHRAAARMTSRRPPGKAGRFRGVSAVRPAHLHHLRAALPCRAGRQAEEARGNRAHDPRVLRCAGNSGPETV